jgi:hypothetical protein
MAGGSATVKVCSAPEKEDARKTVRGLWPKFIIAHRLSTIRDSDPILVISRGRCRAPQRACRAPLALLRAAAQPPGQRLRQRV